MIILFINYCLEHCAKFNFCFSLKFRAIISLLTSLLISFYIGPYFISLCNRWEVNQCIRIDGPRSHFDKQGTPTMGGIIILCSIVLSIFLWTNLLNHYVWYVLFILITFGTVGFIDDYYKVLKKNSYGLNMLWKYCLLSVFSFMAMIIIFILEYDSNELTRLVVPFLKNFTPSIGVGYIFLGYFSIIATSNAVNLSDGLDGLVIMPIIFISFGLGLIALATSNLYIAHLLCIPYIFYSEELFIICSIIIGSGLGFLWFNTYPAKVFMGDVGALSLGGALGMISVLLHHELLLLIMAGLFVVETVSVILQILSFKLCGYRVFLMAPIHHHFELKGYSEPQIVVRFWIISLILVLISLVIL